MRTFIDYVEQQKLDTMFENAFRQLAIEAEHNSQLNDLLLEQGWGGMVRNAGQAIKQFGQTAWSGLKAGAQGAYSQMTGPLAQYQNAIGALQKAWQQISKDPNWSKSMTTGGGGLPAMNLATWLQQTIAELQSQLTQVQNKQVNPATTQTNVAATTAQVGANQKGHGPNP